MNAMERIKAKRTVLKTTAVGAALLTLFVGSAAAQPDQAAALAEMFSGNALQVAEGTAESSTAYFGQRVGDWVRWGLSEAGRWTRWGIGLNY